MFIPRRFTRAVFLLSFSAFSVLPVAAQAQQVSNDMADAQKAYAANDYAEAFRIWKFNAEWGDAQAQSNLGALYYLGQGTQKSYVDSVKWYRKAAVQDHAEGQAGLAACYERGHGVIKDLREALRLYEKSAALGGATGKTGAERVRKAIAKNKSKWPETGNVPIENSSVSDGSKAHSEGNYALAYAIFKFHTTRRDPLAQTFLGSLYDEGQGVEKSTLMGAYWHEQSAIQSHPYGQHNLAYSYQIGKGVAKNLDKALDFYKKAAAQGIPDSQIEVTKLEAELTGGVKPTAKFTWEPQTLEETVKLARAYADHTGYAVIGWSLGEDNFEERVKKTTVKFLDVSSIEDVVIKEQAFKKAVYQSEYLREQRFAKIGNSGGNVYGSEQHITLFHCPSHSSDTWSYRRFGGHELTGKIYNDSILGPDGLKFKPTKDGTVGRAMVDAVCKGTYVYKPAG